MKYNNTDIAEHLEQYNNQIYNSKGFIAHINYEMLRTSFQIFSVNFSELRNFINTMNNPEVILKTMGIENQDKFDYVGLFLQQKFSNYLNSALMLIDHSRNFIKGYDINCTLKKNYNKKVSVEFVENGLHRFIQDMRVYMFHYKLPIATSTVKFTKENITHTISLSKSSLLGWDNWKNESKEWLEKQEKDIVMINFTAEYFNKVQSFYDWFFFEIESYHKEDFDKTNSLIKKQQELLPKYPPSSKA